MLVKISNLFLEEEQEKFFKFLIGQCPQLRVQSYFTTYLSTMTTLFWPIFINNNAVSCTTLGLNLTITAASGFLRQLVVFGRSRWDNAPWLRCLVSASFMCFCCHTWKMCKALLDLSADSFPLRQTLTLTGQFDHCASSTVKVTGEYERCTQITLNMHVRLIGDPKLLLGRSCPVMTWVTCPECILPSPIHST